MKIHCISAVIVSLLCGGCGMDTQLSEYTVEHYITDEAIDLGEGSTVGGAEISTGAHVTDTTLAESEVEAYISNDAIDLAEGSTIGGEIIATGDHPPASPIIGMTSLTGANATIRSSSFETIDSFTVNKISGSSDLNFQITLGQSVSSYTHNALSRVRLYNETTGTEIREVQGVWLYGPTSPSPMTTSSAPTD